MAGNSAESGRSVTSKIAAILLTFTDGNVHSLTEIACLARLPISTAHRLASELVIRRLLERTEDGQYRIGLPLQMIGVSDLHPPNIEERAPCVLEDLSHVTRTDVRLGVLNNLEVHYIEKRTGHRPVTSFSAGARLPAHPTALGRALLAYAPPRVVDAVISRGLRRYTSYTVTAPDRFRRALAVTRLTRVAVTRWELEQGTSAVAMPVFGPGGRAFAAIEARVHDLRSEFQMITAALTVATRSLSRELATGARAARPGGPELRLTNGCPDGVPGSELLSRPPLSSAN